MEDFKYRNKQVKFWTVTGTVLSSEKRNHTETHTSTSGGGGYLYQGSGYISAPQTTTHTTAITKHEFWLATENGEEEAIKLSGVDIPLREGQKITVVEARKPEDTSGHWILLVNHSANRCSNVMDEEDFIKKFDLLSSGDNLLGLVAIVLIILSYYSSGFVSGTMLIIFGGVPSLLLLAIILRIKWYIQASPLRKRIKGHLDMVSQEVFQHG